MSDKPAKRYSADGAHMHRWSLAHERLEREIEKNGGDLVAMRADPPGYIAGIAYGLLLVDLLKEPKNKEERRRRAAAYNIAHKYYNPQANLELRRKQMEIERAQERFTDETPED